jgi:hypothetical protein
MNAPLNLSQLANATPVRPVIDNIERNDDDNTVEITLFVSDDQDIASVYTVAFEENSSWEGISIDFADTCTLRTIDGDCNVLTTETVATPDWAHYFVSAELAQDAEQAAYQAARDYY